MLICNNLSGAELTTSVSETETLIARSEGLVFAWRDEAEALRSDQAESQATSREN
jgi:hypothetical protein